MAERAVLDTDEELEEPEGHDEMPPPIQDTRRKFIKKSKTKKKADVRIKFDWPKKNYFEINCEEPAIGMVNILHVSSNVRPSLMFNPIDQQRCQ